MNRAAAPGTLDDFVAEFLKDLVDPATAASLHAFFVALGERPRPLPVAARRPAALRHRRDERVGATGRSRRATVARIAARP